MPSTQISLGLYVLDWPHTGYCLQSWPILLIAENVSSFPTEEP